MQGAKEWPKTKTPPPQITTVTLTACVCGDLQPNGSCHTPCTRFLLLSSLGHTALTPCLAQECTGRWWESSGRSGPTALYYPVKNQSLICNNYWHSPKPNDISLCLECILLLSLKHFPLRSHLHTLPSMSHQVVKTSESENLDLNPGPPLPSSVTSSSHSIFLGLSFPYVQ